MATTVARLQAILSADTRQFTREMDQAEGKFVSVGKSAHGFAKSAAFAAGAAGIGALTVGLTEGIREFNESQKVTAQTEAVLRSMGKGAGVTAKQIENLADAISKKSGIDDEAIQSGENLLLTFRNIRNEAGKNNDIFTQATQVVTDFSVRFGKDIPQSSILVGKALTDPIKGLTALRRVGVSFTADQVNLIKSLVGTGLSAKQAAEGIAKAKDEITKAQSAQRNAADQLASANDSLRTANEALAKSHRDVRDALYGVTQAQQHVRDAQRAYQDAVLGVKDAQRSYREALRGVADAEAKLEAAQWHIRDAQKALTEARKEAARQILDLRNALDDARLSEEAA